MKTKNSKKTNTSERFFQIFAGEYVKLYTKLKITESASTEEGELQVEGPMDITGYLLDYDDRYYYLGSSNNVPSVAVDIDEVVLIQVVEKEEMIDTLFDNMDPTKIN